MTEHSESFDLVLESCLSGDRFVGDGFAGERFSGARDIGPSSGARFSWRNHERRIESGGERRLAADKGVPSQIVTFALAFGHQRQPSGVIVRT